MRVRINSISLEGTSRSVDFEPGLNIVTGPIASGKTTLLRYCRSLLGASFDNFPPEARAAVQAVKGNLVLADREATVVRPAVTTADARVDVSTADEALRLPAYKPDAAVRTTYTAWLLEQLKLPRLSVPSRPTSPDSEPTPVTIRDYMLYCSLPQNEIGDTVFGHRDPFRNIKRRYVFQILYGIYSIEIADIQERLREVQSQLRGLRSESGLFQKFLEDTPLSNRAALERHLADTKEQLRELESAAESLSAESPDSPRITELRAHGIELRERIAEARGRVQAEVESVDGLRRLLAQLETHAARLTRSIVADKHLTDIEFVVCPRCGAEVEAERGGEHCYLCLQTPSLDYSRDILVKEQSRVENQLAEALELLEVRRSRQEGLKKDIVALEAEALQNAEELDFETRSFVSERATEIAARAEERARLRSRLSQLQDYLSVFAKLDLSMQLTEELQQEKERLEADLENAGGRSADADARIEFLDERFDESVSRLQAPEFGEEERCSIDRTTFLPRFRGRRFDDLSSPGLATLVNLAHAVSHQLTDIHFNLNLPNILLIDGLSEHFGEEGLDPQRREAAYQFLIDVAGENSDRLQIIVVDNDVPEIARAYVRLDLSEDSRLIPEGEIPASLSGE